MVDFKRILSALKDARVQFVIIGGVAASAQGSAYVTYDLDICYERSRANIERLVAALRPYHPRLRGVPANLPFRFDAGTLSHGMNFTLTTDLGDLDMLGEVTGLGSYKEVRAQAIEVELFGQRLAVLSLEGLIQSKRAIARAKDLLILPELEALRELQTESGKRTAEAGAKKTMRTRRRGTGRERPGRKA